MAKVGLTWCHPVIFIFQVSAWSSAIFQVSAWSSAFLERLPPYWTTGSDEFR
jgi:hypothetical protein